MELQELYMQLELKFKDEIHLREEIVENFSGNAETFETKIFEFEEFREKLGQLKDKFKEEDK